MRNHFNKSMSLYHYVCIKVSYQKIQVLEQSNLCVHLSFFDFAFVGTRGVPVLEHPYLPAANKPAYLPAYINWNKCTPTINHLPTPQHRDFQDTLFKTTLHMPLPLLAAAGSFGSGIKQVATDRCLH